MREPVPWCKVEANNNNVHNAVHKDSSVIFFLQCLFAYKSNTTWKSTQFAYISLVYIISTFSVFKNISILFHFIYANDISYELERWEIILADRVGQGEGLHSTYFISTPMFYPVIKSRLQSTHWTGSYAWLISRLIIACPPPPPPGNFPRETWPALTQPAHALEPPAAPNFIHLDHTWRKSKVTPSWERTRPPTLGDTASHSAVGVLFIWTRRLGWGSRLLCGPGLGTGAWLLVDCGGGRLWVIAIRDGNTGHNPCSFSVGSTYFLSVFLGSKVSADNL